MATLTQARRRDVLNLQIVKALRSLGQGALLVTFSLYLSELGWQAAGIGLLFSVGGLLNAALSLPIGVVSDRIGRKHFVIGNEIVIVIAALMATLSSNHTVLITASLLGAFGRGQVGMVGPAGPAEQAWIAGLIPPQLRGRIYSDNSALGFAGMGIGAIIAGFTSTWSHILPGTLAYRPFFAIVFLTGVINLFLLGRTYEAPGEKGKVAREKVKPAEKRTGRQRLSLKRLSSDRRMPFSEEEQEIRKKENRILMQMGAINAVNALGIGLTSPLLSYWFFVKFGTGPSALGPVFALTFFATGIASVATGRVAEQIGLVRSVVSVRMAAVIMLLVLPIVPLFWIAALIHVVRSALNRGTAGTRQALTVSVVRDERRGFASSMNSISQSLPNAIGPLLAGYMLDAGYLTLPFLVAAAMQFAYGILFMRLFRAYEPQSEPKTSPAAS